HHHLRYVHRPAFGEGTAPEHRASQRLAVVRRVELEIVAGDRFMNSGQALTAVVVLPHLRFDGFGSLCFVGRGDEVKAVLALVERTGRGQKSATVRTHEDRRPDDLQRVAGQADDAALAAKRLDALDLFLVPFEQLVCARVVESYNVEDALDHIRFVSGDGLVRYPGGPHLAGQPDHLATHNLIAVLRARQEILRSQVARQGETKLLPV